MHIENEVKLDYSDVLIRPKRSTLTSRVEVDLHRDFVFKHGCKWRGVPIVAANMDTTGTIEMANALCQYDMLTCLHKHITHEDMNNLEIDCIENISFTCGKDAKSRNMLLGMINKYPAVKFVTLDVANGYMQCFADFVNEMRNFLPDKIIIAGNVVTAEMTEALLLAGADIVKVGIGPGSVCTTRKVAGVGYPQLSAVIECADAAHGIGGHVMADGGCVCSGDVAKAFGAGADFVMLGGMFAGHDECAGELNTNEETGELCKTFYGMSSETAMDKYNGGVALHRASEGKTVSVPYRGKVRTTVLEIMGGVRSACTYVGARKIKHLPKCCTFVRVNRQLNNIFGT
jgi:GMP reductase